MFQAALAARFVFIRRADAPQKPLYFALALAADFSPNLNSCLQNGHFKG
jgi:hypothetical protein